MTDVSGASVLFDPLNWFGTRAAPSVTTGGLSQPILPGWSFGDVIVNENNSSSPATERRILAQDSYGRQIGRVMDAVCELIQRQGGAGDCKPFEELMALQTRIAGLKRGAVDDHLAALRRELAHLKAHDPERYAKVLEKVRALLV